MFKLPECPYCGYRSDYKSSVKALHSKEITCRKCGKKMSVAFKLSAVIMAILFFVSLIIANTLYLKAANNQTIIPNFIMTVVLIILYCVLVPLRSRYKKIPGQEDVPEKLKKNRHRHKKVKNANIIINEDPLKNTSFDN
ncbi:MAG: hypothetical protein II589_03445 [Clostridia bacterium]|nr:hypothetical protein [Clostridia bacterium]